MACVLIVDDEPFVLQTVRSVLVEAGHVVFAARDGVECEDVLKFARPDVVVLDLFMPRQDGFQTIAKLKARNPALKMLVVSGGGETGGVDAFAFARQCGAHGVVRKPFEPEDLVSAVDALLPN